MPMYNLLKYSENCSITLRGLWTYYRYEAIDDANENNVAGSHREKNNKTKIRKHTLGM